MKRNPKRTKRTDWVWIRIGDAGEYRSCSCVADAIDELREGGVTAPIDIRPDAMALYAPGFEGQNYVSIYWGDTEAQPTRNLNAAESQEIVYAFEPIVDVIFRVWKAKEEREPFALFPALPGTNDPATCCSYARVGQHGSANTSLCMRRSRAATPAEYTPLQKELESIGYRLRVVKGCTYKHEAQRRTELESIK